MLYYVLQLHLLHVADFRFIDNISGDSEHSSVQENSVQNNESASTPAYIVMPDGDEYVEMKSSIENGSVL
ncbi:MAG: hypothetical protein HDT23_04145 [Ruminococcus sp.]|nr:hypothetical protein [Ruminococcus sp.]